MTDSEVRYLFKELKRTIDESDTTAAYTLCQRWILKDALKLLKEQEAVVRCKDCKHRDPEDHKCDCGHDIQWQLPREDDWFCADGKKVKWDD